MNGREWKTQCKRNGEGIKHSALKPGSGPARHLEPEPAVAGADHPGQGQQEEGRVHWLAAQQVSGVRCCVSGDWVCMH